MELIEKIAELLVVDDEAGNSILNQLSNKSHKHKLWVLLTRKAYIAGRRKYDEIYNKLATYKPTYKDVVNLEHYEKIVEKCLSSQTNPVLYIDHLFNTEIEAGYRSDAPQIKQLTNKPLPNKEIMQADYDAIAKCELMSSESNFNTNHVLNKSILDSEYKEIDTLLDMCSAKPCALNNVYIAHRMYNMTKQALPVKIHTSSLYTFSKSMHIYEDELKKLNLNMLKTHRILKDTLDK
jgi:hypothetical protein